VSSQRLIRGCTFHDTVRVGRLTRGTSLAFVDCRFLGGLSLGDAEVAGSLTFVGCYFGTLGDDGAQDIAVDLENARVGGDLTFFGCRVGGRLFGPSLSVGSDLRLLGCHVAPGLAAGGGEDPLRMDEMGAGLPGAEGEEGIRELLGRLGWTLAIPHRNDVICLDGAVIGADLEITFAGAFGVRSPGAEQAAWRGSQGEGLMASVVVGGISAVGLRVGGGLSLAGTLSLAGGVDLSQGRVERDLRFNSASARTAGAPHFRTVPGAYPVAGGDQLLVTSGDVTLRGCTVGGSLGLALAEVEGSLSLYGLSLKENVELTGCRVSEELNASFSSIGGMFLARRDDHDRARGRPAFTVGGDLSLSGASVKVLELRGAEIQGDLVVRTGRFGRFILSLSAEPEPGREREYWPRPCRVRAMELSAIHVEERLELSAIQVVGDPPGPRALGHPRGLEPGLVLSRCEVGRDVTFFLPEPRRLADLWGGEIRWARDRLEEAGGEEGTPPPEAFRARIRGGLDLRANTVGGRLDLRNVEVETLIQLTDSEVSRDVNMGWSHGVRRATERGLATRCGGVEAEKLRVGGNLDLSGLRACRQGGWERADLGVVPADRRGALLARGARVTGEILLLPRDHQEGARWGAAGGGGEAGQGDLHGAGLPSGPLPQHAWIEGAVDLTAAEANHLILSRNNLPNLAPPEGTAGTGPLAQEARGGTGVTPRVSLERGRFSRLEIVRPPPPPNPINLSRVSVDRWVFGKGEPEADDYISVLDQMHPFDRSTWIDVESSLRNQALDGEADKVYRAMRWAAWRDRQASRRAAGGGWRLPSLTLFGRFTGLFLLTLLVTVLALLGVAGAPLWATAALGLGMGLAVVLLARDGVYGTVLGYGTWAWAPMVPVLLLAPLSLAVFSHPLNVRASSALLQVVAPAERAEAEARSVADGLPPGEVGPTHLGRSWAWPDALALTLRYQVPIIPAATHGGWEAGSRRAFPGIPTPAEHYALFLAVYHWLAWPLFLIWVAARIVRGRSGSGG